MSAKVIAAILARDAAQFLVFKRAMGVGYQSGEFTLKRFLDFVSKQYGEGPVPLNEAVTRWATRIDGRKPVTVANEFGVVRQLCLFRRRSDPPRLRPRACRGTGQGICVRALHLQPRRGVGPGGRRHAARGLQHVGRDIALSHARAVLNRHAVG